MQAYQGYTQDGKIVTVGMPPIPDGYRVIVTVLDFAPPKDLALQQGKALEEFAEGLEQCEDESLSSAFDEIMSHRMNIARELEL